MLHRTRPVERDLCFPYEVVQKEGIGRCLVATRKIEPGELIFQEDALTIGPLHDTKPVCLGCLTEVKAHSRKCVIEHLLF